MCARTCGLLLALAFVVTTLSALSAPRTIDPSAYLLRSGTVPEWDEFANKISHGRTLDIQFMAESNHTEATLFIRQRDVKLDWNVQLNGRRIGKLFLMENPLVVALPIAQGVLKDGTNRLSIIPPREGDDIVVGEFRLDSRPMQMACEAALEVQVTDRDSRAALPCRITIADEQGALAPIWAEAAERLAVRPGVVYTGDGQTRFKVLPGRYTIYASRGFEYGISTAKVLVKAGASRSVRLRIRREVATPGWASCDTHIHTFTYARHGDASLDERMLTLAGEGIELPVSTEHNSLIDFAEPARRLHLESYFTPLVGCEVTTAAGHFNAFPIRPGSPVADSRLLHWPSLMESIRAMPGVQVIVLNHPRDVHNGFIPFAATNFNAVSGENLRGFDFTFNAVELINSGALRSDWRQVYHDWFALLNYGCRVTGVGASDCHDVSRFIVGQGRTYIRCRDTEPAAIEIDEACQSLLQGRALVSLGLLTDMRVDDKFAVGDLATGLGEKMRVTITVLGPSWTTADRIELYSNGTLIRDQALKPTRAAGTKAVLKWTLLRPKNDCHLVAIASGSGVTSPHWAIPRPYQPTSAAWEPRVLGSTNPIWIDGDGDGRFTSARAYARALFEKNGTDAQKLLTALAGYDEAVAAQAASLCRAAGQDVTGADFARRLSTASEPVQRGFRAYAATLNVER
jgi:hypothetical protein